MKSFFKRVGIGILVIILLPLAVAGLALATVFCILLWIGMLFWAMIRFFQGRKVLGKTERDIQAARILKARQQREQDELNNPQPQQPQGLYVQNAIFYQGQPMQIPGQQQGQPPYYQGPPTQQIDQSNQTGFIGEQPPSGYIAGTPTPQIEQKEPEITEEIDEPKPEKKKKWWQ